MQGYLSKNQIEYILYHLNLRVELTEEIRSSLVFFNIEDGLSPEPGKIYFPLCKGDLKETEIITIEEIPILYPGATTKKIYRWQNNSLVFNHDLFKSSFYLLSAYQEQFKGRSDKYRRFPYVGSIQQKLGIIGKPVVNYYFDFIAVGLEEFCKKNKIDFHSKSMFTSTGFMLSHDVDVIDSYTFRDILFRMKQIILPLQTKYPLPKRFYYLWKYTINYFRFFNRKNPHWDFEYLVGSAKNRGFKSVFYFLHKDVKKLDSKYTFGEKRIRKLFAYLTENNCEIGLHGSVRSAGEAAVLKDHLGKLEKHSGQKVDGIRQHLLIHNQRKTAKIQQEAGLTYDATLGFAEHEGFRNSFCLPFKLYDFEKDEMLDLWQIPLIVMDATLVMYRQLDYTTALESVNKLIDECKKCNGIFTLLWHNGNFDEEFYPYGKKLYESILDKMKELSSQSLTGKELIKLLPS